jgi:hypothetical protein
MIEITIDADPALLRHRRPHQKEKPSSGSYPIPIRWIFLEDLEVTAFIDIFGNYVVPLFVPVLENHPKTHDAIGSLRAFPCTTACARDLEIIGPNL